MENRLNMKSCFATCAGLLAMATAAFADFPIQDMGPQSLGIRYGLAFRGQNITVENVPSHEIIHSLTLAYAPVPYASVQAGVGLDAFDVETRNGVGFQGDFGICPAFGIVLASPYFALDLLRGTGGARFLYMNSGDDKGFRYSAFISNPFLGVVFSPSPLFDLEAGIRAHFVDGIMRGPGGSERNFANDDIGRVYATFTVKSPAEGAFLSLDLDASPNVDTDWSQGPREAQIGISFGAILGGRAKPAKAADTPGYFPAYREMKEKQDRMSEEIE